MADEGTSVGKVRLDIEISQKSLNGEMNKLGSVFNSNFKNMFSQTTGFVKGSLDRMTNSFKSFSQVGAGSTNKVSGNINKLNSDLEKTQSKIDETNNKLAQLYAEQDNIIESYKNFPTFSGMGRDESLEQMLNTDSRYSNLASEIGGLENQLQQLRITSDTTKNSIRNLQENLSSTNNTTKRANDTTRRSANTTEKFGKEINRTGQNARKSTGKIAGFANMIDRSFRRILRRLFIYNLIFKGIRGIMNYTGAALKTNKQFMASLHQIKTNLMVAFQPIYDFILPALNALMRGIATVTTYIATAISALFGKTYKQSYDSTKGIEKAKKAMDGYGKSAKKAKGQLAGFDEVNVLSKDSDDSGGGSSNGFEMTMPDTSTIDFTGFEKFREMLQPTIDSLKNLGLALEPLKNFVFTGLQDFYNNFLVPVGKWTFGEGLPRFIDAITKGLGEINWDRINESLKSLWQNLSLFTMNVGEGALRFWEKFLVPLSTWVIGEGFPRLIDIISNGLAQINWEPILNAFDRLWEALLPFAVNVGEGLLWLLENVLVPLSVWTINEIVPRFLDILAESISILNGVIDALKPTGQWLFNSFLKPLAEWTGGIIISVLDGIAGALRSIGDWIKEHKSIVEAMAIAIGSFMLAWKIVDLALLIKGIVGALVTFISTGGLATAASTALGTAIAFLTSPITLTIAAIGALIATGVLLCRHWDEISEWIKNIWESIKNKAEEVWNNLSSFFTNTWNNIKNKATTIFTNVKDAISNIFNAIKTTATNIWNGITSGLTNAFNSIYNNAVSIFNRMKNFIKGITDSISGFFKGMVNGVIKSFNTMINGLNKLNVDVPDWVPGIGGKSLGFSIPKIPMLARGGIVDQPTLAMVGERGREAVMPLENNTGWIADLAKQIAEMMSTSQGEGGTSELKVIVNLGEEMIIERIISLLNREARLRGEVIISS